ncbi:CTC-interacting domain 9 [Hibiscus trionum]|uniref:CTC-interacting domain 9 n=1 Tax=Hibiscus trionum TaxID=183268 RepID=A0A9W7GX84_HIBTR|nr:CTC-interacting domain 9 [Hibiscus trionum]
MAAVADKPGEAAVANGNNNLVVETSKSESKEFNVQKLVDMFTKLNPLAKEFFPSYYYHNPTKTGDFNQVPVNKQGNENYSNRRRRSNYSQGNRKLNGKAFRAQRDDSIRRTLYVSDIDQNITEEQLAGLFSNCGQVVDCRICGDPRSVLRFAFVEFADEEGARAALNLGGTMLGFYPVRVLPSKTAILPVNPTFLPRSEDEREMCTRTVYCTNIDKKVSQAEVKNFFESACGEVTCLRLLGDNVHSTRIAFVEFAMAESAIVALNCSGMVLGTQPIRVSPSKTPVRPRVTRPISC